ncbi:hypothetical protein [Mycobacterium sp. ZZG]
MAQLMTRRAALGAIAAGSVLGIGYLLRALARPPMPDIRLTQGPGMMDMRTYMEMFRRHNEFRRSVEETPGGVRTVTESDAPDLVARLQAHVADMYGRVDGGAEVMCMSESLPTLFRRAADYRRTLTLTPAGIIAEETSADPAITAAIREHAREVSGFVHDGMPAMMGPMMRGHGMMGPP